METLWIIFILLVITRLCGAIAARLSLPVLAGEIIAGVMLGVLIGWIGKDWELFNLNDSHHFMTLADLGIFFLMLLGGLEMQPQELLESRFTALSVAILAMLIPLVSGFGIAWLWLPSSEFQFAQSFFVGTALAITAVPVTIKVLIDMKMLKTAIGKLIVSAAVIDDLLSLILLSILTAILNTGRLPSANDIIIIFGQTFLFVSLVYFLGRWLVKPTARYINRLGIEEMVFSFLLILGTIFAMIAEVLGLHFILGAFAAGLSFGRNTINQKVFNDVKKKVSAITTGFLAPIFFASIGMEIELSAITETPLFLITLITIAFLGKILGAAIPCYLFGYSIRQSVSVGVAMSSRGVVELIIAGIALRAGLFEVSDTSSSQIVENLFSTIVLVAIITTLVAPIGFRLLLSQQAKKNRVNDGGGNNLE
ncbi:cation:proton antiporter [Kangiella koreensis]|uniref:Sodium/hydrogen exchanger n=1 Tax=Kangiella koreensis (strain DSM 16069 / JCM 12317 / KCTC 12182 / SW-125) TaxID=523791 RepID=C7RBR4_KANKD|nr:cation:proton antiporter [Kangiella koreensis]ACV26706.1 sodium/hydrogen exchanger [Kangiella koreensis DSM 16069]